MLNLKIGNCSVITSLLVMLLWTPSNAQKMAGGRPKDLEGAFWIAAKVSSTMADSLMYGDHPASLFRKEFNATGNVKKATLTITAAGYYLITINGKSVKNNVLDPAWTNFGKRINFTSYDVTELIGNGINTLGVELGNGFYNLLPLKMFGRNLRTFLPTGEPQWIAMLQLHFRDGTTQVVVSDTTWKTAEGPVIKNNVYLGVHYDARREMSGWNLTGFNDRSWHNSIKMKGPGGELQLACAPPIKVTKIIEPLDIHRVGDVVMVDMGTNMTGLYKIKLSGKRGDTIRFRFGERLYQNGTLNPMTTVAGQIKQKGRGGPGAPAIAWQTDSYIFGNENPATFQPRFTFHTFRYIEITGLKYVPKKEDLEGQFLHSDVENQNYFNCSSPLLNDIQKICRQTFLSNLISVQSDCPAREKFGYGGDLNATSETFICNFDMQTFYRKTIYDWVDAMQDSIFIDTAPYVGIKYCGISWESAFLTTQYKLFQYYGDTSIVNELYNKDLEWMEKVDRLHPDGMVDKGLSDHESMFKVPVQLIGTSHYLECARIMRRFAIWKRDLPNIKKFDELEKSLTRKLLNHFWYQSVPDPINRQTLFATLLYYKIIPQNDLPAAQDSLLKAINREPSGHFTTGIFGTKFILEALSSAGHADQVYQIVNSTTYPGWGFMVQQGATTLWETWKESDNVYSNCHPMFGTVSEWYFRWLAGIRPSEDFQGFGKFMVSPSFPDGLDQVDASYHAPQGDIKVAWKRTSAGKIELNLTVPFGTIAQFKPAWKAHNSWVVTNVNANSKVKELTDQSVIELKGGVYHCITR